MPRRTPPASNLSFTPYPAPWDAPAPLSFLHGMPVGCRAIPAPRGRAWNPHAQARSIPGDTHAEVPVTASCPRLSGIHRDAGDTHQLSQSPGAPLPLGEGTATSVLPLPPPSWHLLDGFLFAAASAGIRSSHSLQGSLVTLSLWKREERGGGRGPSEYPSGGWELPPLGGFDLDFALSLTVSRLHPTHPGSKIPKGSIPWSLGAHAPHHPEYSTATAASIPFHGLTGKERIILGLIGPELIEFTFPSAREALP